MAFRDAGKDYFQTSESIASSERKQAKSSNQYGRPIKLPSKILAIYPDTYDARAVYIAEAAGNLRRVVLETGEKIQVLRAPAPLTSISISPDGNKLFAGCWDKQIHVTDYSSGVDSQLSGHTDFVKCLLSTSINGTPLLISGSADSTIIVWDLTTGKPRYRLKGHTKAVQDLAIDPHSWPSDRADPSDHFILFSSSSDREIRRWQISIDSGHEIESSDPILAHETGVWRIRFDSSGDLWTASADKTAQHLVRSRKWAADTTLPHPDYVKDIVVSETLGLVITACRDEEVRVWDIANSKVLCTYTGHFEEVTALLLLENQRLVVSTSIDGTIRQWSLDRAEMARFTEQLQAGGSQAPNPPQVSTTAEEDAELEALMEED